MPVCLKDPKIKFVLSAGFHDKLEFHLLSLVSGLDLYRARGVPIDPRILITLSRRREDEGLFSTIFSDLSALYRNDRKGENIICGSVKIPLLKRWVQEG